jgi:hypothetical protein
MCNAKNKVTGFAAPHSSYILFISVSVYLPVNSGIYAVAEHNCRFLEKY